MASDVKWIKIKIGLFDGTSFKRIKKAKIGGESFRDKLTAVWFELLDLGAKCNNDGLLYSDEIPYGSEEDIAIMIDRDVEEVKLCLQFYVSNGMVEIVDNLYCLSNWTKYQNNDGLEKIREQNRIRQKRYYEKKKIEKEPNVIMTLPNASPLISNNLISNNNINIYNICLEIYNYWNDKEIIVHRQLTEEIENQIQKSLKEYTIDEIKTYIDRYAQVIKDKDYDFWYKWTLVEFLKQKNAISNFADDGSKWVNYLQRNNNNRKKEPDWLKGYVDNFENEVEDLDDFMKNFKLKGEE